MIVYIGSDHRGYKLKDYIKKILEKLEIDVVDVGTHDGPKSCDYPKFAYKVATPVAKSKNARGILVCLSGIGQSIAANKVKGAYAALCYNVNSAEMSRRHNNSNVLVIGVKITKKKDLPKIVKTWLTTEFEGGRHRRRINQIKKIEKGLPFK